MRHKRQLEWIVDDGFAQFRQLCALRIHLVSTVSLAVAALVSGCATEPAPPTVEEVVAMSKHGTESPAIIDKMRESRAVYRLPGSEFAALKSEGVSDTVLDYMLQTYLKAERERQVQNCTLGPPYEVIQ